MPLNFFNNQSVHLFVIPGGRFLGCASLSEQRPVFSEVLHQGIACLPGQAFYQFLHLLLVILSSIAQIALSLKVPR
jgi:hypothetical protein